MNSRFFKTQKDTVTFIGENLTVSIPMRYENHDMLTISGSVTTLGIFDMRINGVIKEGDDVATKGIASGLMLPGIIAMYPTDVTVGLVGSTRSAILTFVKGDVFIKNVNIVRDKSLAYKIFYEMVYGGHTPEFMTYRDKAFIFDYVAKVTGLAFPTDHSVIEMIMATLHRNTKDSGQHYRLTTMKEPPLTIPLGSVAQAATSTSSKFIGAYMEDGIDDALVNVSEIPSDIENLLRK